MKYLFLLIVMFPSLSVVAQKSTPNTITQVEKEFRAAIQAYNNKNYNKAFYLFERAAKQGHQIALYKLAWMYYMGEGTPKNLIKAYAYSSVAVAKHIQTPSAAHLRDHVAKQLNKTQLQKAQNLSLDILISTLK